MKLQASIQTKNTPVFYDVRHCPQRALILVASCHSVTAFIGRTAFSKQYRDLRTELSELERAGEKGYTRASGRTSSTKACDRVEIRICARTINMANDIKAEVALDPS